MVGNQPSNLVGFSYKLSEQDKIKHCCSRQISNNRSMTGSLSLLFLLQQSNGNVSGTLKCLLFLRLLKKQQKFQMCFSGQVRVYTSIFDPVNLTDQNTGVLPPSLGFQKTECNVGVGKEINLATPEKLILVILPVETDVIDLIFFLDFPERMLLK